MKINIQEISIHETGVFVEEVNICNSKKKKSNCSLVFNFSHCLRAERKHRLHFYQHVLRINKQTYLHFFTNRATKPVIPMLYVMQINEVICVVM